VSACTSGRSLGTNGNGERRSARSSHSVAIVALLLLGGGLPPESRAQEGHAAIRARDETPASKLEGTLNAEHGNPSLRYERARAFSLSGAPEAALAEFDALLAEFPDDADYLLGRAQMQARLGRNAAAVETVERALRVAPDYEDVWQLRLQLVVRAGDDAAAAALRAEVAVRFPDASWWHEAPAPVEYRHWLSAGSGTDHLSNGVPDWSRQFLHLDWQTAAAGAFFAEIARSQRFEESDSSLYAGGTWDALPQWQLSAALGVTEEPRFLPERELSVDAMRSWTAGWGTAFGFRKRDYVSGGVSSYSFTGEKYISDYRIAYRLDRARLSGPDSALTHAFTLTWYPSDRRSLGVTLGGGEEIEIVGLDQLLRTSIANVTLSGNETLSARLSLSWWLGAHEQGDLYRRKYAGLSVRVGL
jgi:YaiO family outer membrane protein